MRTRRFRGLLIVAGLFSGLAMLAVYAWSLPDTSRTEIYQGVYLTIEKLPNDGSVMIVEAHWDQHGVEIHNRDFSFPVKTGDPKGPHYTLAYADLALAKEQAAVLVNTTLFSTDSLKSVIPGTPVRSNETLVVNGKISHVHAHSYLLYLTSDGEAGVSGTKPPRTSLLGKTFTGIGLQGIQILDGKPRYGAIEDHEKIHARTFIGIDPDKKVLYLMAFEGTDARTMIDTAIRAGVIHGGQLDSGNSTNLLIGSNAKGVKPHTGIRNCRPIGPYLTIKAEPLS